MSLPPTLNFAKVEEEIFEIWKKNKAFETQDRLSKERGDKEYTFYDGPPFATGLPHYGHILAGTIKDVVTRYAAQTNHHVERRAGWDCHGLPVEYEIDQKLGIKGRDDVLEMGIDNYNEECRSIVLRYTKEWENTVQRLGRWIDFDNDYKTMDVTFMESVWWVFSQLYKKNLVYRGYKVMPFSTACGTPISNFEAGLNYKNVKDPSIVVTFPLLDDPDTCLVAWTTTPWTLPSNIALCVHPTFEYITIQDKKTLKKYILAKTRLCQLYPVMNTKKWKPEKAKDLYDILETQVGKDLFGTKYVPIFDYFKGDSDNYFTILMDNYVTDETGTGIVHQAPAFGEDDYRVCLSNKLIIKGQELPCPVDVNGNFTSKVPEVQGLHVKKADGKLLEILKENNRLYSKEVFEHSYPYCWRSDTPLIYKAVPSWFVKVEDIKDDLVHNNTKTNWVPATVGENRFHKWLVDARDWAVSRNRFWGTPMPIWTNDDFTDVVCIGSIEELSRKSGKPVDEIQDIHRHFVDDITIPSEKFPGTILRRIDEVFDCWFESGSMPYAQKHYPFENKELFESTFPADFVAEGLDQTRGWFYTLMVLGTALFNKPAFKNLICNGLVLASDGKKMSKRLKNYPDPMLVISKYGADALRMYLINSPVVRAEPLKFQEQGVLQVIKDVFLPWYNAFRFFVQNVSRWEDTTSKKFIPDFKVVECTQNPTDVWIVAATQKLIQYVHQEMQAYRLYTVMPALVSFVVQLSNWYIRLNRERLKAADGDDDNADDCVVGLQVLYHVLLDVCILMAPVTPFFTEYLYQHLRKYQSSYEEKTEIDTNPVIKGKSNSVHYLTLPAYTPELLNDDAVKSMTTLQSIVECGRNLREKRNISLRIPVKTMYVILRHATESTLKAINGVLKPYIESELNAWEFIVVSKEEEDQWVKLSLTPNFTVLGKKLGKKMKAVKTFIDKMSHSDAIQALEKGSIVIDDITIDTNTEVTSKLSFARTDPQYEAMSTPCGSMVLAIDCTQDAAILAAGKCREFINAIQQLRKSSGIEISDSVDVFYKVHDTMTTNSDKNSEEEFNAMVQQNHSILLSKLKGTVPLPFQYKPEHSVVIGETQSVMETGGTTKVDVIICRRTFSVRSDLDPPVLGTLLATLDPSTEDTDFSCVIDGVSYNLKEGVDYWKNTYEMVKHCHGWFVISD